MDFFVGKVKNLRAQLFDFILNDEGDLGVAMEAFYANKLSEISKSPYQQSTVNKEMVLDMFLVEGKIYEKTPIDLFIESQPEFTQSEYNLVNSWRKSFLGLFAVINIFADGCELMNWMTAKHYIIKVKSLEELQLLGRVKNGEILLARIAPVTNSQWIFSAPITIMGKLGKLKLAIAIGNFKQNYKNCLYTDAPELLEEAWQSVEQYHQTFVDFFNTDEITLPGYQLQKRFKEFQEFITQRSLEAAGIDASKSLKELAETEGISSEEMANNVLEMGVDAKTLTQILEGNKSPKMVMPDIELPNHLKKAEHVTLISHPRWGQMFLTNYDSFKSLLKASNWRSIENAEALLTQYLKEPEINISIWQRLASQYPFELEKVLRDFLNREDFNLQYNLKAILQGFNKSCEPELPEIASVPTHLHKLFQEAMIEVNTNSKSQPKSKSKAKMGFA
jgi:ssDNA-specific exonuclease RecJ